MVATIALLSTHKPNQPHCDQHICVDHCIVPPLFGLVFRCCQQFIFTLLMTDSAPSEFVFVEHPSAGGESVAHQATDSSEGAASDWTHVRMEERDSSPVVVNHETGDGDTLATGDDEVSEPSNAPPVEDMEALKQLQKDLDDQSLMRFVNAENAKLGAPRPCECLGASNGIHRPTCPLRQSSQ